MSERYGKVILAALDIQQKRIEIKRLLDTIAKNLTAHELICRDFDNHEALRAITNAAGLNVQHNEYVKAMALYQDVEISLNCDPDNGGYAMKQILAPISTKLVMSTE